MGINTVKIIVYLIVTILLNIGTYFFIREMIWSIVWCDKKSKKISDQMLKMGYSRFEQIKMTYLKNHVINYKKKLLFWLRVKTIFIICELVFLAIYIVFSIIHIRWTWVATITLVQSFIWLIAIAFQFRHKFLTKYDLIRKGRKR